MPETLFPESRREESLNIEKVAENIYANVTYDGANVACINTRDGMILIDTPMLPPHISEWKSFVSALNPKGVRYIINTHIHFDHVIGNRRFGAPVIAHELLAKRLFEKNATLRESFVPAMTGRTKEEVAFILSEPLVAPEITLSRDLEIHLGGVTVKIEHLGGHTEDSVIVYEKESRTLFTGDLLTAYLHPYKGDAIFEDWLNALRRMRNYDIRKVVPGHGKICDMEALDRMTDYFQKLEESTRELVEVGTSREDVIRRVRERMFEYFEVASEAREGAAKMFDLGTSRLYREIAKN